MMAAHSEGAAHLRVVSQAKLQPKPTQTPTNSPSVTPLQNHHPSFPTSTTSSTTTTTRNTITPNHLHSTIKPNYKPTNALPRLSINPTTIATPPSNASSPDARFNKMSMASVISPGVTPPPPPQVMPKASMTTKEWVVPPRPKPGRKPATDTPPTKRKAQNRAAQRAFRERRAARVGELEEQLDEQKEERDRIERELREKIHTLELDLHSFRSKCSLLESLLDRERQERIRVESEADNLRRRQETSFSDNNSRSNSLPGIHTGPRYMGTHSAAQFNNQSQAHHPMQLPGVSAVSESRPVTRTAIQAFAISQIISPPDPSDPLGAPTDLTCGNCQPNGPCACVEEALRSVQTAGCGKCDLGSPCQCLGETTNSHMEPMQQLKRSSSPSNTVPSGKRLRPELRNSPPPTAYETDFTNAFKRQSAPDPVHDATPHQLHESVEMAPRMVIPLKDSCGFCDERTFCVCAEAAASAASMGGPSVSSSSLPSIFSQASQALSPPPEPESLPTPIEFTSTGAVKLRQRQKPTKATTTTSKCGPGGPGTCAQCLADPQSGLFCRTLAAINASGKSKNGGGGGGCCGGAGPGGGCCKTKPAKAQQDRAISISCADTYKTLASHRNFDQAFEEIGTWLPKLKVVPRPGDEGAARPGRPAVEIDAASIMTTLKDLDVRFGPDRR